MKRTLRIVVWVLIIILFLYHLCRLIYFPYSLTYDELRAYQNRTLVLDNGMQVNYRMENKEAEETVVIIHGGGDSIVTWDKTIDYLAIDFKVIAIDMPGHGLTDPFQDRVYNQFTEAAFLEDVFNKLNLDKFTLIGHSFGGHFSTQYAIKNNDKLNALILIASGGYVIDGSNVEIENELVKLAQSPLGNLMRYFTNFKMFKEGYASYAYDESVDVDSYISQLYDLSLYSKNRGSIIDLLVSSYNSLGNFTLEDMKLITAPVLLIWGDKDKVALPETVKYFQRDLPHAELIMYENVGHNIHLENRIQLNKDLSEYIKMLKCE